MNTINLYSIPPLICSIIVFAAGIYVLLKNFHATLNRSFFLLCLSTGTWLSFYSINFLTGLENKDFSTFLLKAGYCGIACISITFLDYILTFLKHKHRKTIFILNIVYGLILLTLIIKTNLIIEGLYSYFWGLYPKAGILHPIFISIFMSHCFLGNILTVRAYLKEPKETLRSRQLKYLVIGFLIFSTACWDYFGNYGFELYPFGYLPSTLFIITMLYAVIRYNLMDLKLVFNRSIVYSFLITSISLIYFLLVIIVEKASQNLFKYNSILVSILSAIIIAVIFVPLKNKIQLLIDRLFLSKTPIELESENKLLRAEVLKTEKLKSVAILASGMAHEIRNPLTALKTFSEYLPHKMDDKEFLEKFAKIVGSEVDRIDALVSELLEFAKPSPVQLQKTNINKLIKDTLDFLSNRFVHSNIQVTPELSSDCDQPILLDPNKMRQVFLNLFLNAVEAMRDGGRLKIASQLSDAQNDVIIKITDTGCGIAKENLTHIFDPFFSTKDTGTGLGLPITYGIIKEHGGEIKVDSQVGKGTTFTIILSRLDTTQ